MSTLIDDVRRAEICEERVPYQVYRWCVWETTERCQHNCDACPFSDVVRGEWEDGTKRTFESACKKGSPEPGKGKLKFTDGFVSQEDALGRFRKLPRRVWEAQQESKRPTLEGLIFDVFDVDRHVVERWEPDPANGVIDCGLDFGGTVPHAAVFWQQLDVEVEHRGKRIPVGAHVCFDEVYPREIAAGRLLASVLLQPFGEAVSFCHGPDLEKSERGRLSPIEEPRRMEPAPYLVTGR